MPDSHERRSAVLTTNVEPGRWGTVFADDKLAAAIVGRVVHHGRLIEFGVPSHRLEESPMLGKGARGQPRGKPEETLPDALDIEAIAVDKHDLTPKCLERARGRRDSGQVVARTMEAPPLPVRVSVGTTRTGWRSLASKAHRNAADGTATCDSFSHDAS